MIYLRRLYLVSAVFVLLWLGQPECFGQVVEGYSGVLKSTNSSEIDGYSSTETSYGVAYYYNVGVIGYLFDGASQVDANAGTGLNLAEAYPRTTSVHQGDIYTIYSEHYLIARYYTSGVGYSNPYNYYPGTGFVLGDPGYPPGYSFTSGGGPESVQEEDIYLGYTYQQFSTAPPHVSSISPRSIVRGTSGSFYLQGTNLQDDFGVFTVRALNGDNISVAWSAQSSASLSYTIAADATEGTHRFTVSNTWGESEPVSFTVLSTPPSLPPLDPCAVTSSPKVGFSSLVSTGTPGSNGSVVISFSGAAFTAISATVTYGPSSTPSSIASNIAALISTKYLQFGLSAKAFGSRVIYGGTTNLGTVSVAGGTAFTADTSSTAANGATLACYAAPLPLYRCLGLFPSYDALHVYTTEGVTETPRDHIIRKHVAGIPTLVPPNTVYTSDGLTPAQAFSAVQRKNFITVLANPLATSVYRFTFPHIRLPTAGGTMEAGWIGTDAAGNDLYTNTLYLSPDRCFAITSFPTQ